MQNGLTQATRRLTELAGGGLNDPGRIAPIVDLGVSPEGTQIAFASARTVFPLGSPSFVSPPAPTADLIELYDVDIRQRTLTRVTQGYLGGPSEQPHSVNLQEEDGYGSSPGLRCVVAVVLRRRRNAGVHLDRRQPRLWRRQHAPRRTLAAADNGSDAFLVKPEAFVSLPTPQAIGPAPATSTEPEWKLGVSAVSRADGTVLLYVSAPRRGHREGRRAGHRARPRRPLLALGTPLIERAARKGAREQVATRTVAAASAMAHAGAGELVGLVLRLGSSYAALASSGAGLSARVSVTFSAKGEAALRDVVTVTFKRTLRAVRHTAKSSDHRRSKRSARR